MANLTDKQAASASGGLSDAQLLILLQVGLPTDRLITYADLHRPDDKPRSLIHDYGHMRRAKAHGFPPGRWLTENLRVWFPAEIADWLLSLSSEKPTTAAPVKSTVVPAKSSTVAHRKKPPKAKPKAEPEKRVRR